MRANPAFAVILLACFAACASASGTQTVRANVTVTCPFYLSLDEQPLYLQGADITLTYTAYAQEPCSVSVLSGNLETSGANCNAESLPAVTTALRQICL